MDAELETIARALGTRVERAQSLQRLWRGYGEAYRVRLGDGTTAIVKSVRPPRRPSDDRAHRRKCASYDVELAFYRRWAPSCPVRVPRLLASEAGPERWLLVLEDLDAAGYARRPRAPSDDDVDLCLRWLARFHAHHLGSEPIGLWERGTYWDLDKRPDELRALRDERLRAAAPELDRRLRACPYQTIVHGDAKLANFAWADDDVAAFDFQWTGRNVGVCDVAYLLEPRAGHAGSARDARTRAVERYFEHLRAALSARDVDAAAVEAAWRALYSTAVADFQRFYAGWA